MRCPGAGGPGERLRAALPELRLTIVPDLGFPLAGGRAFGTALLRTIAARLARAFPAISSLRTALPALSTLAAFGSRLPPVGSRLAAPFGPRLASGGALGSRLVAASAASLTRTSAPGVPLGAGLAAALAAPRAIAATLPRFRARGLAARFLGTTATAAVVAATPSVAAAALAVPAAATFASAARLRFRRRATGARNDPDLEWTCAESQESARAFLEHGDHGFCPAEAERIQTLAYRLVEGLTDENRALRPHHHSPGRAAGACVPWCAPRDGDREPFIKWRAALSRPGLWDWEGGLGPAGNSPLPYFQFDRRGHGRFVRAQPRERRFGAAGVSTTTAELGASWGS